MTTSSIRPRAWPDSPSAVPASSSSRASAPAPDIRDIDIHVTSVCANVTTTAATFRTQRLHHGVLGIGVHFLKPRPPVGQFLRLFTGIRTQQQKIVGGAEARRVLQRLQNVAARGLDVDEAKIKDAVPLIRERATTFVDAADRLDFVFREPPVIDEAAARQFEAKVNDAIARGAKLMVGNVRQGALYSPTVLDHVTPDMAVVKTETFGPVSPVIRFSSIEEAIELVNCTAYGLSSAVCTNRLDYITRFVTELNVGTVNVREVRASVGAGFVYPICGDMTTMPGLGSAPAASIIDFDANGEIVGLS